MYESIAEIVFTFTTGGAAGAGALALARVDRAVLAMPSFCYSQFDCANFSIGFTCRR